jgi:hypothetical protein
MAKIASGLPTLLHFDAAHDVNGETLGADIAMAKHIADLLNRHYPGHAWIVTASHVTGVATVRNAMLSKRFGMVLHLRGPKEARDKDIVRAGGEFLERWNLARGGLRLEDVETINPFERPKSGAGL